MAITVAKFLDVSNGLQANQFSVGSRDKVNSLDDLDPIYKRLIDEPIPVVLAVMGSDGRPNLTPMWFDYEGSTVLVNVASHRKKVEWIRADPRLSMLLVNPANLYHWMSIKCTVKREISEDDPTRRRPRHRPARQDLDQVHQDSHRPTACATRREMNAGAVRVRGRQDRHVRQALTGEVVCVRRSSAARSAG